MPPPPPPPRAFPARGVARGPGSLHVHLAYAGIARLAQISIRHVDFVGKMTLSDDVNLEEFVMAKDELSGADIKVLTGILLFICYRFLTCITQPELSL